MAQFCFGRHRLELGRRTYIMGILNLTPDSFSDGGRYLQPGAAVEHAREMVKSGADIVDMGAQSTRPGHTPVSPEEEWGRLEPVLIAVNRELSVPISVDTYYPQVAAAAIEAGAVIINDVSGSLENGMPALAAKTGAGLIMMHAGGGSDDCGKATDGDQITASVHAYFKQALAAARQAGLPPERICLDPGIGFGKDRQGDLTLAARLSELTQGLPPTALLMGASRKRVIASCLERQTSPDERLAGTLALHTVAQWNGAHILRVHDVAEAVQAARVTDALRASANRCCGADL